ncbi:MAG: hypothetical protein KDE47_12870, partial [Caldilineaceae bacterium]|nr:hypothetical protein [Caldilineaceae bacterium]
MHKLYPSLKVTAHSLIRICIIVAILLPNTVIAAPATQVTAQNPTDVAFNDAIALYQIGQWQAALAKFEEVQGVYAYYNNRKRNSQALEYIGHAKAALQDLAGALEAYQQSLTLAQALGD